MQRLATRDILPKIVSSVGIVSATALLITCKGMSTLLKDDGFWKRMIVCRFGASSEIVARVKQPRLMYLRMYYLDSARCNEFMPGFQMFCTQESIHCYQALGLVTPCEERARPNETTLIGRTGLPQAFWHSSEETLVAIFQTMRPEEHSWGVGTIDKLAVPADRRQVIRNAIVRYCEDESYAAEYLIGFYTGADVYVRGFPTVRSLLYDMNVATRLWESEYFPGAWLIALEVQDKSEVLGSWVNCQLMVPSTTIEDVDTYLLVRERL